jgi:hypothetical protein
VRAREVRDNLRSQIRTEVEAAINLHWLQGVGRVTARPRESRITGATDAIIYRTIVQFETHLKYHPRQAEDEKKVTMSLSNTAVRESDIIY